MMHKGERTMTTRPRLPLYVIAALSLLAAAMLPGEARAQWAPSPYNGNNISNTNSGSVGVGTNNPGNYRIHVFGIGSSVDAMIANFFGTHNVLVESQAGVKVGLLNNYYGASGTTETVRGVVALGYSNGPGSNVTGYYSRQRVWHNNGVAQGVYGIAEADPAPNSGPAGQQLFGGRFEAKTTDTSGGNGNVAYGVYAQGVVGASINQSHSSFGVVARAAAAAGTDQSVSTYALYADGTNSGAGRAYGIYSAAGTNYFNGNVGVGTASPSYRVDVQGGQLNASAGLCIAGDCRVSWSQVTNGSGSTQWSNVVGGGIYFNSGNVGIGVGTSAPGARLSVGGPGGNVYGTDLWVENNLHVQGNEALTQGGSRGRMRVGTAWGYMGLYTEGSSSGAANDLVLGAGSGTVRVGPNASAGGQAMNLIVPNGRVGIGNSAPGSQLFVGSGAPAVGTLPGVNVALGGNSYISASNGMVNTFIGSDTSAYGIVGTYSNHPLGLRANNTLAVTVMPSGNVGIGTPAPATKLHVAGDVTVDGNLSAKFQDVAEWVPSVQRLQAGTVVVLDAGRTNHVVASGKAYDTAVAGVVSAEPGVILGVGGEGKLKVATTGRVKVRVDATRGAIRIGDLLVTSAVEGVAMKSVPVDLGGVTIHRPGTIIGKALEPLAGGVGEILVLLILQ
jgi:hypothetical protein